MYKYANTYVQEYEYNVIQELKFVDKGLKYRLSMIEDSKGYFKCEKLEF